MCVCVHVCALVYLGLFLDLINSASCQTAGDGGGDLPALHKRMFQWMRGIRWAAKLGVGSNRRVKGK